MVGRKIGSAEFPQRRIKITYIDYVSCRIPNLNPITDPVRRSHQNVDPTYETRDRGLKSEAQDERNHAHRDDGRVPVYEQQRNDDESDSQCYDQSLDPSEIESRGRIGDAAEKVD